MLDQSATVMQVSAVHFSKSVQGSRLLVLTAAIKKVKRHKPLVSHEVCDKLHHYFMCM